MPGAALWAAATTYPTPWIFLASVLCGAAIARVTRRTRLTRGTEAERTRAWLFFLICMCGVVVAWLLGVFVPGPEKMAGLKYVLCFLGLSGLFALGFRFPKTAGLPLVVLITVVGVAGYILSTALEPLPSTGTIGSLLVYATSDGGLDLEVRVEGRAPEHAHLDGDHVAPLVRSIVFDDLWPGLGWHAWYRLEGVGSFRVTGEGSGRSVAWGESRYLVSRDEGASEALYRSLGPHLAAVPGVKVIRSEERAEEAALGKDGGYGRVEALEEYILRVRADGQALVVPAGE